MKAERAQRDDVTGNAAVACSVYLARHSAYLDGELSERERAAHERHEALCASCARYARVVRDGTARLRELPLPAISADFHDRLRHRLYHVTDEAVLAPSRTRYVPWLAAAAVVALVAGAPRLAQRLEGEGDVAGAERLRAAAIADGASPAGELFGEGEQLWQMPEIPLALSAKPVLLTSGRYTPVVVRPPQYRAASWSPAYGE